MKEMLLSPTTGIEVGILLLYVFIAIFWHFLFLVLLIFAIYVGYVFYKQRKRKICIEQQNMAAFVYTASGNNFMQYKFQSRVPRIEANELFVKVYAASINPVDYKLNTMRLPFTRWVNYDHHGIGYDFSGKVLYIGDTVTKFKAGDDVFGYSRDGALQEFTTCYETDVSIKPSNMTFTQAASVSLAGITSLQCLNWFSPIQNKKVLIIGASGGTGHFAVQIAKYQNASEIYGVCSSQKADYVRSIGADKVICYNQPNYLNELSNIKFDLIYDTVTSPEDPDQEPIYSPYLDLNGKYVAINGARYKFPAGYFNSRVMKCEWLEKKNYHLHILQWNQHYMSLLGQMMGDRRLVPNIEVFPFDESNVNLGYGNLKGRKVKGKIVFEVSKPDTYF